MRAVSAAGEKPKVTLGQRLCTKFGVKLCFWSAGEWKDKKRREKRSTAGAATHISLQQPQFRKKSFQVGREDSKNPDTVQGLRAEDAGGVE